MKQLLVGFAALIGLSISGKMLITPEHTNAQSVATVNAAIQGLAAPTNVVVTATSPYSVDLSWKDNVSNEKGFQIQRRLWARGAWVPIAQTGGKITYFPHLSEVPGVTYYYQVRATG